MTAVELLYKITERAKFLVSQPIDDLRYQLGTADTYYGAIAESQHMKRGELIETILNEEFEEKAKKIDEEVHE